MYKDFTTFFDKLLFPDIPDDGIQIHQLSILGRRGSGKTTLIESLVGKSFEIYLHDHINVIYTDDIDVAGELIDIRPLQLVILDDAAGAAASRMAGKNVNKVQDYNMLRHNLKNKQLAACVPVAGLIIMIVAWQRKNDLERAFREAEFQIWKSPPVEAEDRRALEDIIGPRYLRKLQEITRKIMLGDRSSKSFSIGMISAFDREGCGVYRSSKTSYSLPEILTSEKLRELKLKAFAFAGELAGGHDDAGGRLRAAADEELLERRAAYTPADVLRMNTELDMTLQEIANKIGRSKTTVHRWLEKARRDVTNSRA